MEEQPKAIFEATPPEMFRSLQRRDWELWSIALLLMTVFAAGLIVYFYANTTEASVLSPTTARYLWLAFFGLVTLVVLLNVYLIARKRALAHLWRRYLLQLQELERERELGMLDPVTQVFNRRYFDEVIPKEIRRSDRTNRPLSLLLVDVDDFKQINQQQGHFVGDEVLRTVGGLLRDSLRCSDYAFRFGGDEFLLVLPETPAEGAALVARRLHARVAERADLKRRLGRVLSITIGQETYTRGRTLEEVVNGVERALQEARARPAATPSPAP